MKAFFIPDSFASPTDSRGCKLNNRLILNDLGGGIAQPLIHGIYFYLALLQKLRTIVSDATRGHL